MQNFIPGIIEIADRAQFSGCGQTHERNEEKSAV